MGNQKDSFHISLTLGDKTYKGEGATALEALRSLPKPERIVAKGVLKVSKGNVSKTLLFMPTRLKRLFYSSPTFQAIHAKQLSFGVEDYARS